MEVKEPSAGYFLVSEPQLTEIGPLPADWSVSSVGDEFHVQLGKMLDMEKNVGTPKLFLGNRAVQWGRIDASDVGEIRMSPSELQRYRLADGDLLVCEGGEVGRSAIWRDQLEECYYQKALHRLRPKRGYSQEFMAAVLEQFAKDGKLQNYVTQTSIAHLPKEKFVALPIPKPATTDEQRRISRAVGDADTLIASLEQLLTKKRQIKQGAMQELLTGRRRLPGFSGTWTESTLIDLAERKKEQFDDGDWIESEHIRSEGIRLIQTGNIGVGTYLEKSDKKYIDDHSFSLLKCKELKVGDLLICRLADPAGRACVLPNIGEERVVTSVDVTIFRPPAASASRDFLVQVFSRPDWFSSVSDLSGGTTHKRISRGALGRMRIVLPPLNEQIAIAQVLTDMDANIAAIESRLSKARSLKQAMAQALLTGRIRLVEPTA